MTFFQIRKIPPIRIAIVQVSPIAPPMLPIRRSVREGRLAAPSASSPKGVAPVTASALITAFWKRVSGQVVI